MGVPGLSKWLEGHGCTTVVKEPVKGGVSHLCLDMNGLCHAAYSTKLKTVKEVINAILALLKDVLRLFPLRKPGAAQEEECNNNDEQKDKKRVVGGTICACFDGPAPKSKLEEQKRRRRSAQQAPKGQDFGGGFLLTCGSPTMKLVEDAVFQFLREHSGAEEIFCSGSSVPGEGELKIVEWWHKQFPAEVEVVVAAEIAAFKKKKGDLEKQKRKGETAGGNDDDQVTPSSSDDEDVTGDEPGTNKHDEETLKPRIAVITTDSDMSLAALGFHFLDDFLLVNPHNFYATSVEEVLAAWTRGGAARWSISRHQLPSVRRDFSFLMCLAGGDHYPGLEGGVFEFWTKYRKLRHTNHRAPPIVNRNLSINLTTLKECVLDNGGHQHKSAGNGGRFAAGSGKPGGSNGKKQSAKTKMKAASTEPGAQLLKAALWNMTGLFSGTCANQDFVHKGEDCKPFNFKAALGTTMPQQTTNYMIQGGSMPQLFPLQVYVAVSPMAAWDWQPRPVKEFLTNHKQGHAFAKKLQDASGCRSILETTKALFKAIEVAHAEGGGENGEPPLVAWSQAEKELLTFTEPMTWRANGATQ